MDNKSIKIVFMGTPEFAAPILEKLAIEFNVAAVITQPDKPFGRDFILQPSAIKQLAQRLNIPVFQPEKLRDNKEFLHELNKLQPDIIAVAAYGKILPREIINLPKHGCLNVHPSLLSKYRGASPIQAALLNGDKQTGVSIILMDLGLDTGDILAQETAAILPEDDAGSLHDKLSKLGADLLVAVIPEYVRDNVVLKIQDETKASFCKTLNKDDGCITWINSAQMINNKIRAFTPWPTAFCLFDEKRLVISKARVLPEEIDQKQTGEVFRNGEDICVKTGRDYLVLDEVQLEGKNKMPIAAFVNGHKNFIGSVLK
ncbi:methionyl-tRNA formyltransferase [Candidatus Falkowbacteria bacterium]|nr:methionyl-tRNA formyltransferase [Candidatus Falkowbacteria bacterium]